MPFPAVGNWSQCALAELFLLGFFFVFFLLVLFMLLNTLPARSGLC